MLVVLLNLLFCAHLVKRTAGRVIFETHEGTKGQREGWRGGGGGRGCVEITYTNTTDRGLYIPGGKWGEEVIRKDHCRRHVKRPP